MKRLKNQLEHVSMRTFWRNSSGRTEPVSYTHLFQGGRHAVRVDMISDIEKKYGAQWHE